jgi:acylphosphatase
MHDIEQRLQESANRFSNAANAQEGRIKALEVELARLNKQKLYLVDELERMTILEDLQSQQKASDNLNTIEAKIRGVEEALQDTSVASIAQGYWDECAAYMHSLQNHFQDKWAKAQELREALLKELKELGELKRVSENVAYRANQVQALLKKQEMQPIKASWRHHEAAAIPVETVRKYL